MFVCFVRDLALVGFKIVILGEPVFLQFDLYFVSVLVQLCSCQGNYAPLHRDRFIWGGSLRCCCLFFPEKMYAGVFWKFFPKWSSVPTIHSFCVYINVVHNTSHQWFIISFQYFLLFTTLGTSLINLGPGLFSKTNCLWFRLFQFLLLILEITFMLSTMLSDVK